MAETLPLADDSGLSAALATWGSWGAGLVRKPTVESRLAGHSNDNFLVTDGYQQLVVRVERPGPLPGVDRETEYQVLADIQGQPFAPEIVFAGTGLLVSRYIEHAAPATPAAVPPEVMGELFRTIHTTPIRADRVLEPVAWARTCLEHAQQLVDSRLVELAQKVLEAPPPAPSTPRLCHHDPGPYNVLVHSAGITVIDWEYSRLGHPLWDLAAYIELASLSNDEVEALIHGYGYPTEGLGTMRRLYLLVESLWWVLRDGKTGDPAGAALKRLESALESA